MHAGTSRIWVAQPLKRGLCLAVLWLAWASVAGAQTLSYTVDFRGSRVATQQVTLAFADGALTARSEFAAELPVFVAHHRLAEDLSVTYATNGNVLKIRSKIVDGARQVEVNADVESDGVLRVIRTEMAGVTTNFIAREDYDFNSLAIYGNAPSNFIPSNASPARVLDVAEGRVVPVTLSTSLESTTFERQNLTTVHTVWTEGINVSHTWHPERFSNLPQRYIRQTSEGEFTFTLIR
ncbi:MAG: hypothetical protein H3C50_08615 [Kiritimatiellae bacterium]|nr:hypothetical protein [Kiritimatiellia bacterium]MCO5068433.1 hypothetical protein [Kiritimatiellia bacterium]